MQAFQCDRCGDFYQWIPNRCEAVGEYGLFKVDDRHENIKLDICPRCKYDLIKWLDKYDHCPTNTPSQKTQGSL